jgi:hypothetical protein
MVNHYLKIIIVLIALAPSHAVSAAPKYKEVASDKKHSGTTMVNHEGVTDVPVSAREINRIVSDNVIYNIKVPEGSPIVAEIDANEGKNAFLQFKGHKDEIIYVTTKGAVYTLRLKPSDIGAQKIHLAASSQKGVTQLYGNKREKLAVDIIKAAFVESGVIKNARKTKLSRERRIIKDIIIKEHLKYNFDDDNLELKIYIVKLANSFKYPEFKVEERNFLLPSLTKAPIAIALSRQHLTKKDYVRLFILGGRGKHE